MYVSRLFLVLSVVGAIFQNAAADDRANPALAATLNCLRNQNCASAKTESGKAADQKALEAVGGNAADKQVLYDISADIMPFLLQQSGDDPEKMQAIVQKAQNDPEAFFNSLPPEIQTKIKALADALEKNQ